MLFYLNKILNTITDNINFIYVIYKICSKNLDDLEPCELEDFKDSVLDSGPICIKFMQWYITNDFNLNSNSLVSDTFKSIFDDCPYHSLKYTEKIFLKDYKTELKNIIDYDNIQKIGSGSIGQVYKSKLKTGETIALKVKHPNINYIINNQKLIINFFIFLQKFDWCRYYFNLHFNFKDFMNDLYLQLNFKNEALNCLRFKKNFQNNDLVIIPKIYFYSNNIIIYSYEEGIDFKDLSEMKKRKVGLNFYSILIKMIMCDNFIHGDLHCKNWKVRKDDPKNIKIILYDFGLCYYLLNNKTNVDIWVSFEENKIDKLISNINYFVDKEHLNKLNENDKNYIKKIIEDNNDKNTAIIVNAINKFLKKKNIFISKILFNMLISMVLLQKVFTESKLKYEGEKKTEIEKKNILLNRMCDLIAFTKKYDFYKEINDHYSERRNDLLNEIKTLKENKNCNY